MSGRRRGRPTGESSNTRETILAAARTRFADQGYDRATMRQIAADAGVDSALVFHYFGKKEELFRAAHQLPSQLVEGLTQLQELPPEQLPEALCRIYLGLAEVQPSPLTSLLRSAAVDDRAAALMRESLETMIPRLALPLTHDRAGTTRLGLAISHLVGVIVARHVVHVPMIVELDYEELIELTVPSIATALAPLTTTKT